MFDFIFLAALGISAVKAKKENSELMSKPLYKTEKGNDVYMDRTGKQYINGRYVYSYPSKDPYGHYCTVLRDDKGNIYSSSFDKEIIKEKEYDQKNLELSEKFGYLVYKKYYPQYQKRLTTEISTGKPVTKFEVDYTKYPQHKHLGIKYYKAYFKNGNEYEFDTEDEVEITKEEYDKIWCL
jgi:hypothetical protein